MWNNLLAEFRNNILSGTENPEYDFTLSHTVNITEEELLSNATPQVKEAYLRIEESTWVWALRS